MKTLRIPHHKSETRSYTPGQLIFNQGEPGNTMYVVQDGEVELLGKVRARPRYEISIPASALTRVAVG